MSSDENFLNMPEVADSGEMEKFEYNSAATPYRISQIYKISYDANLSQDINQPE